MRAPEERIFVDGPAGRIDVIMERPDAPRGIALLLASLAALGPFSIDTYLPSFHDIGATLHATPIEAGAVTLEPHRLHVFSTRP